MYTCPAKTARLITRVRFWIACKLLAHMLTSCEVKVAVDSEETNISKLVPLPQDNKETHTSLSVKMQLLYGRG